MSNAHVDNITTNMIDLASNTIEATLGKGVKLEVGEYQLSPLQHAAHVGMLAQSITDQLKQYDEEVCESLLDAIADGLRKGHDPVKVVQNIVMQIIEQHAAIYAINCAGNKYWPYEVSALTTEAK